MINKDKIFWHSISRDGIVVHSTHMSRFNIIDEDGNNIGTVIGKIFNSKNQTGFNILGRNLNLEFRLESIDVFYRNIIQKLTGSFIVVLNIFGNIYLFTDPVGSIPVVYCSNSGRIGSSASVILNEVELNLRLDRPLVGALVTSAAGGWIGGTLTAHEGVARLLPGHKLELRNLVATRVWPNANDFQFRGSADEYVPVVAANLAAYVEAALEKFDCSIGLTAGWDSRALLAAARSNSDRVRYHTFFDDIRSIDCVLAERMAADLGLNHNALAIIEADSADQYLWMQYNDFCVNEINKSIHPTLESLNNLTIISGIAGEVGRNFLYKDEGYYIDQEEITTESIRNRLGLPNNNKVNENINIWLENIKFLPTSTILDLAYIELRVASWAMAQSPVQKSINYSLAPFGHGRVLTAMMNILPEQRANNVAFNKLVEHMDNRLMKYRVNKFGDYRDYFINIHKLKNYDKLVSFIRKNVRS